MWFLKDPEVAARNFDPEKAPTCRVRDVEMAPTFGYWFQHSLDRVVSGCFG